MAERSGGLRNIVTPADRLARIALHVSERQFAGCGCFLPHLLVCTAGRSLGAASAGPFSRCPFIVQSRDDRKPRALGIYAKQKVLDLFCPRHTPSTTN